MIDPSSMAFDIDDVVADTMSLFLEIARHDYRLDRYRHADITSYMVEDCIDIDKGILEAIFSRIVEGNFSIPLLPLTGAPEVLSRLSRYHRPLLFVTARPSLDSILDWIEGILPLDRTCIDIVATGAFDAKADVLVNRNISFFVEDRLETCYTLEAAGVTPILFKRPWNRKAHPFTEVGSWSELEEMIDFYPMGPI
ncbi:MAG: haloacid dehalogenase [Desulfobacterales bacterium]|nr:haloacid dehalogenase [Desulfobacterales bacterium]